jgi:signal transduction histidine kinase
MQYQAYEHLSEEQPEKAKMAFAMGDEMLQMAHAEARRLISGVRPPILDEAGVETAIAHLVHDRRVLRGPKIEYKSEVQFDRLPKILENALYRIAQETLANACRHSESKKVRVHLAQKDQRVLFEVRDWGVGFDPASIEPGHFGLEGVRERVRLLGGSLEIDTGLGRGTSIRVEVPLLEWDDTAQSPEEITPEDGVPGPSPL